MEEEEKNEDVKILNTDRPSLATLKSSTVAVQELKAKKKSDSPVINFL